MAFNASDTKDSRGDGGSRSKELFNVFNLEVEEEVSGVCVGGAVPLSAVSAHPTSGGSMDTLVRKDGAGI